MQFPAHNYLPWGSTLSCAHRVTVYRPLRIYQSKSLESALGSLRGVKSASAGSIMSGPADGRGTTTVTHVSGRRGIIRTRPSRCQPPPCQGAGNGDSLPEASPRQKRDVSRCVARRLLLNHKAVPRPTVNTVRAHTDACVNNKMRWSPLQRFMDITVINHATKGDFTFATVLSHANAERALYAPVPLSYKYEIGAPKLR